jgi:hypothetical protein
MGVTKLRASTQLNADNADFTALSVGGNAVITAGKRIIQLVVTGDLTNKSGQTFNVGSDLGNIPLNPASVNTVAGAGDVNGVAALLESAVGMAIVPGQFNTNNSGMNGSDAPLYQIDIYNTDGSRLMDGQDMVWGVFTTTNRTATNGPTLTLRLFKGEWKGDGSQATYTAAALDFFMAYPVVTDLSAMSRSAFRSDTIYLSKHAAGLLGSSIGTDELEDGAVTTAKIDDAAVTAAKASLGAALEAGAADVIDVKVDGATVEVNGSNQLQLVAAGVQTAHLADSAVNGDILADDAVDSQHIADGAIDTAHLSADIIDGTKIADDAVDSEHIADGAIDTAHFADASVTGAKTSFTNEQYTGADLTGGGSDTLTLTGTPVVATLFVFVGGALQRRGAGNDYTITGNVITFLSIPAAGDNIETIFMT